MGEASINMYLAAGTVGFNVLCVWIVWSLKAGFVSVKDHQRLERRVSKAETTLDNIPNSQSFHELSLTIERLRGDVKEVGAHMDGMRGMVEKLSEITTRQEEYLLNRGGK